MQPTQHEHITLRENYLYGLPSISAIAKKDSSVEFSLSVLDLE